MDQALVSTFHTKIALPFRPSYTARKILEEFVDIDVKSEDVAAIIERNQYIEFMMLREIQNLGLKENTPSLKGAIALLGMQKVRDFVCALHMIRHIHKKHPVVSADGKLDFKASDYVTFALKTEDYVAHRKIPYADTAYAAGLMFDLMVQISRAGFGAPKGFEEYVAEVYKHSLKTARFAVEIAKGLKGASFTKYVFSACLIHDVGKLAMELLFPGAGTGESYPRFREELAKAPVPRVFQHFIEKRRFGVSHEVLSSQLAHIIGVFKNVEKPILFHHDPYILKSSNKDLYQFSALIALCSNVANQFKMPKDQTGQDPLYKLWLNSELKDFVVDKKLLFSTMLKLGREAF